MISDKIDIHSLIYFDYTYHKLGSGTIDLELISFNYWHPTKTIALFSSFSKIYTIFVTPYSPNDKLNATGLPINI